MALSEIEKLERRYAENPQGLTFAPLAEVHRKNGDVARALELLRPGLTLHPDYIPASIVLGRCHLDLGDMPAAESAFAHVLALDGENVIALKALADITERLFRFEESEQWLHTLLTVDRSNDEARDQLERVEAARRQAEAASSGSTSEAAPLGAASADLRGDQSAGEEIPADDAATAGATGGGPAKSGVADAELAAEYDPAPPVEVPSAVSIPPVPEPPRDPMPAWMANADADDGHESMPLVLEELDVGTGAAGPPPEGIELEQPVSLEEPVQPLAGLVGRDQQSPEPGDVDLVTDFRVETAEDIVLESSGGSEFQVANAAEELLGGRVPPESGSPTEAERVEATLERPAAWSAPVAEPPRHPEPDPVITESMAELLQQQGHLAEALMVYRQLQTRSPGDARLQVTIARLERALAEPPPAPAYSVAVTHGESVQAFLRGMLASRPPAATGAASVHAESARPRGAADPEGAPTRPAHDSLSLSSVFGEDSTPTPPAVPASGSGAAGSGGVSYDEFFGASGASPMTRSARTSDPKSDDLDQFHAWLQNLKR